MVVTGREGWCCCIRSEWQRRGCVRGYRCCRRIRVVPGFEAHELPEGALGVPMMCNLGTQEGVTVKDGRFAGVWPANETFFRAVRGRGG